MSQHSILIVDDSPNILKALQRTFRLESYTTVCANSAKEAMVILSKEAIDVIISDENMPGVSGTELLKQVHDLYPDIIRMMLTGATDVEVAKNAINRGEIWRFFTKPWDDFELLTAVRQALKMCNLGRENMELKSSVQKQERLMRQLEREYPGITEKCLAPDGSIIID